MTLEELKTKREQQQAALQAFLEQANRQVAAMEGAVAMLDALIAEMDQPELVETEDSDSE